MIIINYSVRILTVLLGIVLLTGKLFPYSEEKYLTQIMGAVFILWGFYRIITYRNNLKRYRNFKENEEEN